MNSPAALRETDYLLAWLLFWLSNTVLGFIAGAAAGAIAGVFLTAFGVGEPRIYMAAGAVAGFLIGIPISYLLFRVAVAKIIVKRLQSRTASIGGA